MLPRDFSWLMFAVVFLLFIKTPEARADTLKVLSPAFTERQKIPAKYTCDGQDVNSSLLIEMIPPKTMSLALVVTDPDAPSGTFVHWIAFNISPTMNVISEASEAGGVQGLNDFGKKVYGGPCPPSDEHRYFFKVYALDALLDFKGDINRTELEKAMQGHILAQGQLMGKYKRTDT